jgi:hypothetical protein
MKTLEHEQVRSRILSRYPLAEVELAAHLDSCPDCRAFARQVERHASLIKETLHVRWDPVEPPPRSVFSPIRFRRIFLIRKVSSSYRALAWAGGLLLLVAVLSWAIPRLALGQVFPAAPSFFNLFRRQPLRADTIIPNAEDLGEGWLLTAEKTDMEGSYYFDIDPNGNPTIGTHVTKTEPPFDPELIETVSMRGYAHSVQHWTLMAVVIVSNDTAQAETITKESMLNLGIDRDIPMDQYTFTDVTMGDEAKMVSLYEAQDEDLSLSFLAFRKGRVLVLVITWAPGAGLSTGQSQATALSEAQMLEIGRMIETRIP